VQGGEWEPEELAQGGEWVLVVLEDNLYRNADNTILFCRRTKDLLHCNYKAPWVQVLASESALLEVEY